MDKTHVKQSEYNLQMPFGQYEYVDVSFAAADTDTLVPYTRLTPESPNDVYWIDVQPQTYYNTTGPTDTRGYVYRSNDPAAKAHGTGYVQLRCNVAGYRTRLLLFVERN